MAVGLVEFESVSRQATIFHRAFCPTTMNVRRMFISSRVLYAFIAKHDSIGNVTRRAQ